MRRPPYRHARALSVLVVLAAIGSGLFFAPGVGAQSAEGSPGLPVLETPPSSGLTVWAAHAPSGVERFSATTSPESDAVPATPQGVPQSVIGDPETVIGADGRERLVSARTSVYPLSAIGQIEFRQDGVPYICTGFLIDGNTVLTAGHCTFTNDPPNGVFVGDPIDSARFYPGRNRVQGVVQNPFASCAVEAIWAPDQWRLEGKPAQDFAIQQLEAGCDFSESAGSFGLFTLPGENAFAGRQLRVEGYPGDKGYGSRWKMVGRAQRNSVNFIRYPMDTAGGQSGSPLFKWNRPECGGPCAAAVHAYGVSGNPPMNSGPMMTFGRIGTLSALALQNGG